MALSGDTALAGALDADNRGAGNAGAVYAFGRVAGSWVEQQKLGIDDVDKDDLFGHSVGIYKDTAVVGAKGDDHGALHGAGSAFVYQRGAAGWAQQQKLIASDAGSSNIFGAAVAIHQDTLVVGAYGDAHSGANGAGSAYVFVRSGATWTQQKKLMASDAGNFDYFGSAAAVHKDTVALGASSDDIAGKSNVGSVYVFARSGGSWSQQQKIIAGDGAASAAFGNAVALDGDTLLVGARHASAGATFSGAAYVFQRSGAKWSLQQKLAPKDVTANKEFGFAVALQGDTAVVGAYKDTHGGMPNAGSAYVFTRSGTQWTQQQKLTTNDAVTYQRFGASVALDQDALLVGALMDNKQAPYDSGSAYLFVYNGSQWIQRTKLTPSSPGKQALFGAAVAINRTSAVVGEYRATVGGSDKAGKAHVFDFQALPRGAACSASSKCLALNCYHGVCCHSASCASSCQACNVKGNEGLCSPWPWGTQIPGGAGCAGIKSCDGLGACKTKTGNACAKDGDCMPHDKASLKQGGRCIDKVCCAALSCAKCSACNLAGSLGQCAKIGINKPDDFPAKTCSGTWACDGNGACKSAPGQSCSNDTACASDHCADGVCCKTKCSATCSSCKVPGSEGTCSPISKARDVGCNEACTWCLSGSCVPLVYGAMVISGGKLCSKTSHCDGKGECKKMTGQPCNSSNDCASDHCVDKVCCKSACNKTCEACNVAGSVGTCAAIAAKQDPDKECIGGHPMCGGSCDGKRQCEYPKTGVGCGTCMACDGTGRCAVTPPDDAKGCGVIDCDRLDTSCRDYKDLTTGRCSSFGQCKAPNDPVSCTAFTKLTCVDAGVDAGEPDRGAGKPDVGQGPGVGQGDEGGCGVAGRPVGGAAVWLLLVLVWVRCRFGAVVKATGLAGE